MSPPQGPDLMSLLARLLGVTRETLAGDDAAAVRARIEAVRLAVGRLVPAGAADDGPADAAAPSPETARLSADLGALRAALAGSGAGASAGVGADGGVGGAGGEGLDLASLARMFETLSGWLEQGTPGPADEVDSIVHRLEQAFEPMASPGAGAARKERDERIQSAVSSSISERLREAGIKPPEES